LLKAGMILVGLVILSFVIWFSNPAKVADILAKSSLEYILMAFILVNINMIIRTYKWKVLLKRKISFKKLFPVQIFGMTLSNFTPGKVGEPIKALLLRSHNGTPVSEGLSSIIWERIADLVLLVIMATGLILVISMKFEMIYIGLLSIGVFIAGITALVLMVTHEHFGRRIFRFLTRFPIMKKLDKNFVDSFYRDARVSKKSFLTCFMITTVAWMLDSIILYLCLIAVGITINPLLIIGIIAFSALIGIASSLPGGIGSTEAVMIVLLTMLGADPIAAAAGVLVSRLISFWYGAGIGVLMFLHIAKTNQNIFSMDISEKSDEVRN